MVELDYSDIARKLVDFISRREAASRTLEMAKRWSQILESSECEESIADLTEDIRGLSGAGHETVELMVQYEGWLASRRPKATAARCASPDERVCSRM